MLYDEIIRRVRATAGDTNILQFTDATLVDWINDGVRECALDNQLLQKTASQDLVVGQASYALPTDILKLHSVKVDEQKIRVLTMAEFEALGGSSSDSGDPVTAYVWGGSIYFYPKPSRALPLRIEYTYDPPFIDAGDISGETPPLPVGYHSRLVDYCLAQVAQQDDDMPRYQLKMEEFRTGVHNLKDDSTEQEDYYPMMGVSFRDTGQEWLEW